MTIYIIFMTLFLLSRDHMMYSNLTLISSYSEYKFAIIIHIIITTLYYHHSLISLYNKMNHTSSYIKYMIHFSTIAMIAGIMIPYTYLGSDLLSKFHVLLCMSSTLIFLLILFMYNYHLFLYNSHVYKNTHYFIEGSLSFLGLIAVCFGHVNGYIEMIICFIMTFYIYLLNKYLNIENQSRNKDHQSDNSR